MLISSKILSYGERYYVRIWVKYAVFVPVKYEALELKIFYTMATKLS